MPQKKNKIYRLYLELYRKHGSPEKFWPNWCARKKSARIREIIAIGAILTQRTNWHNADLALENLSKKDWLSLRKIAVLTNLEQLTDLIRPAGFYQSKPKRLFGLARLIVNQYDTLANFAEENLQKAREKLLSINGIGPETAETILLYACDRTTFIIDEYTRRLVKREKLTKSYEDDFLKALFERSLPKDFKIYQKFHTLIIIDQKGEKLSAMKRF